MPRKLEPSFGLKQIIWDIAASVGTDNFSAIYREVDEKLRQLHKKEELFEDETPDIRTLRRIIKIDINRLPPEVVVSKLSPHVWRLRSDYETIKRAEDAKTRQEESPQKKAEEIFDEDDPLKRHFAELSETALTLAANFESFLDMGDGIIFDSKVGNIVYGGWLEPTEYWDHLRDRYRVKMHNIPMFLALDLFSHIRDEFPELAKINDWVELTSNELTYDLIARLVQTAKKGAYRGKCRDCSS